MLLTSPTRAELISLLFAYRGPFIVVTTLGNTYHGYIYGHDSIDDFHRINKWFLIRSNDMKKWMETQDSSLRIEIRHDHILSIESIDKAFADFA